jgi:ankyrin repeat protein
LACKPATEEDKYHRALRWTKVEDVRAHLDGGKDPNHTFEDGARPIHVVAASNSGKAEILRLLLDEGAEIDAKDGDGKTAWELKWGDGKRKLSEDDAAILLALLDGGFTPPKPELEDGRTLLHEVARRAPSARLVSVLVADHGFAVDARDAHGWTPLHVAVHENNAEAATGLLEKGADPNAETTEAIGESSRRGEREVVRWRYEAGSRPLDVARSGSRGRFDADARKVVEQYGGAKNAAVSNRPR